jgi:branched-chain amino acid transport system permease protein
MHTPFGIRLSGAQFLYLVTLVVLASVLILLAAWCRGRTGRALVALRSHPLMARTQGVDTARLSVLAVGVSGAVAGLGGALNALVVQSAIPDAYPFTFSLALLTGAVVGGIRSWAGAVTGAVFVVYVPQLASDYLGSAVAGQWSQVIYAVTLLACLYFAPAGPAGLGRQLASRRHRGDQHGQDPFASPPSPAVRPSGGAHADTTASSDAGRRGRADWSPTRD